MTTILSNEEYLEERFELKWRTLKERSTKRNIPLTTLDKYLIWNKVLDLYRENFVCEYCRQRLLICDTIPPHYKSFSIDHRIPLDANGTNNIENIAIVCTRCNIIKGTMTETTFRAFINPLLNNPVLLDQVFKEMWNGRLADKLQRINKDKKRVPPSDSTLPGCISSYSRPLPVNKPCSKCRDKELCEDSTNKIFSNIKIMEKIKC